MRRRDCLYLGLALSVVVAPCARADEVPHVHHGEGEKLGTVVLPGLLQRGGAGSLRPRGGPHPLLLVRRGREGLRRGGGARSLLRDGLLGHRHEQLPSRSGHRLPPLSSSAGRKAVAKGPVARPSRPTASADYIAAIGAYYKDAETRGPRHPQAGLRDGHGAGPRPEPEGPRGRHLLRPRPPGRRSPDRQDLRQAEEGGRHPERGAARAPRTTPASPTT